MYLSPHFLLSIIERRRQVFQPKFLFRFDILRFSFALFVIWFRLVCLNLHKQIKSCHLHGCNNYTNHHSYYGDLQGPDQK